MFFPKIVMMLKMSKGNNRRKSFYLQELKGARNSRPTVIAINPSESNKCDGWLNIIDSLLSNYLLDWRIL